MATNNRSRGKAAPQRLQDGKTVKPQIERSIIDDPKQISAIKRAILSSRQGPTSRQAASFVDWQRLQEQLGQPFDAELIPLSKLRQMRRDPMISFGLHYIKTPLVRAPWRIKCPDPQVAAFIDAALRPIYARLIFQATNALDFGFQAVAKEFKLDRPQGTYINENGEESPIWTDSNIDAVMWKTFSTFPPELVRPAWNDDGEFNGIIFEGEQDGDAGGGIASALKKAAGGTGSGQEDKPTIDVYHSLWFTNEKDSVFGSVYGYPRIAYAYRYWWSWQFRWALADRAFERQAVPPLVGYHPEGAWEDLEGNEYENVDVILEAMSQIRSGGNVALPSELHDDGQGGQSNQRQWAVDFLKGGEANFNFHEMFDYIDVMKLRSIWVPEQAFVEGEGGTSSRNVAAQMAEIFIQSQTNLMAEIDDHINRYLIPQLLLVNFPEFIGECVKITTGFSSDDIDFMKQVVQLVGQDDWRSLGLNIREAMERVGLPVLSPAQMEQERARLIQEAAAAQPPPVLPAAGEAAGVIEDDSLAAGFAYTDPGEVILLSDDADFLSRLPDTPYFQDKKVKAAAAKIQSRWAQHYQRQYTDFAKFVEGELSDLNLAEGDEPDVTPSVARQIAEKIVNRWKPTTTGLSGLKKATSSLLKRVAQTAAKNETSSAGIRNQVKEERLEKWSNERLGYLLAQTEKTNRSELTAFLANQIQDGKTPDEIRDAIREHYDDAPKWKADRVARTETQFAYNTGTIMAARSAGVKQVQASDASDGKDDHTDEECVDRNGELFSVAEALVENEREHPNGTLYFRLVPNKKEVAEVEASDEDLGDALARYDEAEAVIYFSDDATNDERAEFRIAVVDHLREQAANGVN